MARLHARTFGMGVDRVKSSDGVADVRLAKRILLSNQISITVALLNLPYVLIYPFMGKGLLGWLEIPLFLGYASVHRLNGAGFTMSSRVFLILLSNLDILTYSMALGRGSGMHFLFLLTCWAPLALFDWENRKAMIFSITLSALFFLGSEAFGSEYGLDPLPPGSERGLYLLTLMTALLVQYLFAIYFFRANRRTERALALAVEKAKAADRAKGVFLANMSEEIRSPLDTILKASKTMMDSGLGPDKKETLQDIHASASDLSGIVGEILDMSRIEAGRMRLEYAPFALAPMAHGLLRPFEFEAGNRGLGLDLDIGNDVPAMVIGDAARLRQVLRNLLGNAIKFTEAGRVTLRIRSEAAGMLAFEVEDTGVGIPEDARGLIFEPFFQADASASRKHGGTGLGLFICKQMVELMGGRLSYRAAPRAGAIFRFTAALAQAEKDER